MKVMNKTLGLLLLSVVFVACGSDDDEVTPVVKSLEKTHTYSIAIQGIENQDQNVTATLELKDAVGEEVVNNLISADLQRGGSFIKVRGLRAVTETGKIKDMKITIGGGTPISLGTCTYSPSSAEFNSDIDLSSDKYTDVCKALLDALKANKAKNAKVELSFTPDVTLTLASSPVYLDIAVSGLYKYNTYPTN